MVTLGHRLSSRFADYSPHEQPRWQLKLTERLRLGHPSGTLLVTARFDAKGSVSEATVFRTARRDDGRVGLLGKKGLRRMERCIAKEVFVAIDFENALWRF